ncbi:MAG: hypothetical protein ABIQ16_27715 [Polyangiaceae bacterium]
MTHSVCQPRSGLRIGVASSICLLLAACASTTGRGWVSEGHYEPTSVISSSHAQHPSIPAAAEAEPEPQADVRPRLNHTVTLGEIDVAPTERGADAAPAWGGPSVTINNYNVMNTATSAYGYLSYGSPRTSPSFSVGTTPRTGGGSVGAMTPGQNWPTVADHGPSFPYHAGPASPWSRSQ